jgi:membrane protease YdiL (CAAX protease family)
LAVRHDTLSQALTVLACLSSVYLATFQPSTIIFFPVILLVSGLTLQFYLGRFEVTDSVVESSGDIALHTLAALAGLAVAGLFAPLIPRLGLTGFDAVLYGALIAVAEEQFFRGAVLNMLLAKLPVAAAIPSSALIFAVYHLAVYGSEAYALVYVSAAGLLLAYVSWRSGRLSPAMIAHIANNIFSLAR